MEFYFDDNEFLPAKRTFTLNEMLDVEHEESLVMSTVDIRDMFGEIIFYAGKKEELLNLMPTNCADVLITDNPSVHNLNILKEILNLKSTILICDIAGIMLGDEENRIERFLSRNGYEFIKKCYIGDYPLYDYRKSETRSLTDIFVKGIPIDVASMCFVNSLGVDNCVILDSCILPDITHYSIKTGKNIVTLLEFKEANMKFIDNVENKKESLPKVDENKNFVLW